MSFQATEWARGLPLHSLSAKFTLMMIGSYAGTDGVAFPSLDTLAEDTLQTVPTVRRRIRELEKLGLLVTFSRWLTPDGSVVRTAPRDIGPPGCRQSSNEIRLQLERNSTDVLAALSRLTDDKIETADQEDGAGSEDHQEGINLTPSPDTVLTPSPSHSLDTPGVSEPCNPLKRLSNSSSEATPPTPPDGGKGNVVRYVRKKGQERLAQITPIWPEPVTNADRAIAILDALDDDEWAECLLGVKGFAAYIVERKAAGKDRTVKDFHNWARNRQWAGFLAKGREAQAAGQRIMVAVGSAEGRAWRTIYRIAGFASEPFSASGQFLLPSPMTPQLLAFADAPAEAEWMFISAEQRQQVGAWSGFLRKVIGVKPRPELVSQRNWRRGHRIEEPGFVAPWPWPPRVDGSLSTGPPPDEPS
jgi:hypothetical protein